MPSFLVDRPRMTRSCKYTSKPAKTSVSSGRTSFHPLNSGGNLTAAPKPFVGFEPPQDVETSADPATLAQIVAKTGAYWSKVGETAPHWSVLTHDAFLPENLSANLARFYESGVARPRLDPRFAEAHWSRAGGVQMLRRIRLWRGARRRFRWRASSRKSLRWIFRLLTWRSPQNTRPHRAFRISNLRK